MAYFASEMQKDWRMPAPGLMFGRHSLLNLIERDRYGQANINRNSWCILEGCYNMTLAAVLGGAPMIRCNYAGGGADCVTYNTYVTGGTGAGTSTAGCFLNFCGISALMTNDIAAGNEGNRQLLIAFPDLTAVPVVNTTLTQLVTGAQGIVIATSNVYNYVIVRDLETAVWTQGINGVFDPTMTMVPNGANAVPRGLVYATHIESNADCNLAGAIIWSVIRGYCPAWVQGDVAGIGYNGDILGGIDCTPLTWNDDIIALVAANYHEYADEFGTTLGIYVNPDNVIAHAMQGGATALDNTGHTPELILVYVRADEPLVYAESTCQGVWPGIQRG